MENVPLRGSPTYYAVATSLTALASNPNPHRHAIHSAAPYTSPLRATDARATTEIDCPPMPRKLRVGIVFGGRSGEHEVSLRSAASVLAAIDKRKYEVVPIGIAKTGHWFLGDEAKWMLAGGTAATAAAKGRAPSQHALVPSAHATGSLLV